MHRKGSMELSVNSIVILVIAVVMMGLILGFIRSKFSEIGGGFVVDESAAPEATASDPIAMSRNLVTVSGTKKTGLNINFYNTFQGAINPTTRANIAPNFHCQSPDNNVVIRGEYFKKMAEKSKITEYSGNIRLLTSVPKDTYLCKVCFVLLPVNNPGTWHENRTCNEANSANLIADKEFQLVVS